MPSPIRRQQMVSRSGNFILPTDVSMADALSLRSLYELTAGWNWTTNTNWGKTTTAANWFGITVAGGRVTQLKVESNNLVGSVATWAMPTALTYLYLYSNTSLNGDISGWALPASMQYFYIRTTSVSGDISGWTLPASLVVFAVNATSLSGDISGWTLPASLIQFYIHTTSLSGNISGWTLPASLAYFYVYSTSLSNAPIFTSAVALQDFQYQNCALSQAHVDANCLGLYGRRASFTYATPAANLGGTNSTPSGTYQDGDPPTTGKEYVYELENDPETEGFNPWTFTYTA